MSGGQVDAIRQRGVAVLERPAGAPACIVNTLTHERAQLPDPPAGSVWQLDFDEEGGGFIFADVADQDPEVRYVDDLLSGIVCESDTGTRFIVTRAGREVRKELLAPRARKHTLATIALGVGALASQLFIEVAQFDLPRPGGAFAWNLLSLSSALNFDATRRSGCGEWVQDGWSGWCWRAESLGLDGSFLKSVPYARNAGDNPRPPTADDDPSRVLTFPSATTGAVIAQLAVCAYSPQCQGGMRQAQHRGACVEVLAFVLSSVASEGFEFQMYLDSSIRREWPVKAWGERPLTIVVHSGGALETEGMMEALDSLPASEREEWLQALPEVGAEDTLSGFVERCSRLKGGRTSAWRQTVWAVGDAFDRQLFLATSGDLERGDLEVRISGWAAENNHQLDRLIVSYVAGAREACQKEPLRLSLSTDKSRVQSNGLMNTAFALPSNIGFWGVPQVIADFIPEADMRETMDGVDGRQQANDESAARQRLFLKRAGDPGHPDLRPRKRHRKSAYQWLVAVDNQVRQVVDDGLMRFVVTKEMEASLPPEAWPRVSVAPDQGGDGTAALFYCQRHLRMNVDITFDTSHGLNNDLWLAIDKVNWKNLMMLWLVVLNVLVGPWQEDMRYKQCVRALGALLESGRPQDSPLFMALLPHMVEELADDDISSAPDVAAAVWDLMKHDSPWSRKGTKIVKSRFMAFTRAARVEARRLSQRSFGYLYTALECGFIGKAPKRVVVKQPHASAGSEPAAGATSAQRETPGEKALRTACANNLALAAVVLNTLASCSALRALLEVVEPLESWHNEQNSRLRSVEEGLQWSSEQIGGAALRTLCEVLGRLSLHKHLKPVLELPTEVLKKASMDEDRGMIFAQDSLATSMADFALAIVAQRLERTLWQLRGWPSRLVMALRGGETARLTIAVFRYDFERFMEFSRNPSGHAGVEKVASRSCFHLMPVRQDIKVLESAGWAATGGVLEHIRLNNQRLISSQVCEDAFNRQQNVSAPNRRGVVQKSFSRLMETKVLIEVHRFVDPPAPTVEPVIPRDSHLAATSYEGKPKSAPKEFAEVTGFAAKTKSYTSTAQGHSRIYADLSLVNFVVERRLEHAVDNAWFGEVLDLRHHILVRHRYEGSPSCWFFPLCQCSGSSCLLWPAEELDGPPGTGKYFMPKSSSTGLNISGLLWPLLEFEMWEAMRFDWRSPAWQAANFAKVPLSAWQRCAIRAFPAHPPRPLLTVCAENGFWSLKTPFLARLANALGISVDDRGCLSSLLESLMRSILQVDDEKLLSFLEARLGHMQCEAEAVDAEENFLNCDDAAETSTTRTSWRKR